MNGLDLHVHRWEPGEPGTPTLLLLHGTGGDENDLIPLGRMLAPGAALLSVRGNVREHGAPRFFRRLAEGVFDVDDLHRRTAELGAFVEAASKKYGFAQSTLYATGFSNGANIGASLLLAQPAAVGGGALFRAMVPFEPVSPSLLAGKRVLISAGEFDAMIPRAGTERLAAILRGAGAEVKLVWQAGSHGLTPGDIRAGQDFFAVVGKSAGRE